jgi:hypothetical protein
MRTAAIALVSLFAACSGGSSDAGPFTQQDLQGSWRVVQIFHGGSVLDGGTPGWVRGNVEIDADGGISFSGEDSEGRFVGGLGASVRIDAEGYLSTTDPPSLDGRVNKGRDFLVATATDHGTPSMRMALKTVPQTTWSIADLASSRFAYHFLSTGTDSSWEYGEAWIDASGVLSLIQRVSMAGGEPDETVGTLSVGGPGIVTLSGDSSFKGYLSADKTVLVASATKDPGSHAYAVGVFTRLGQSFVQADLAGSYGF